jgi:hypothetical protein
MYKVNEKEYSFDSSKNQEIKRQFVDREVFACVTSEAEYILGKWDHDAPFTYDDIENYYRPICPECNEPVTEEENESGETVYKCSCCEWESDEEPDTEAQEIFEWWLISDYLADKLIDKGEAVIKGFNSYWGRGCSGQAILLDYVISEICHDMGILEGQDHDWSNK